MKDLQCNIKDSKGNYHGSIKVHLIFDVPEELLAKLGKMLGNAWEQWQDDIIMMERSDHA